MPAHPLPATSGNQAKRKTMAKLSEGLLSVLRCPVTGSELIQVGDELVSTTAGPNGAPLRYAIDEDIALMLPPEHTAA